MHALNSSSREAETGGFEVEATLAYRASSERPKKKKKAHEEDKKCVEVITSTVIYYYTHSKS